MATLDNKSIRSTLPALFRYTNNPDKNLPPDGLAAAAAYIRGEHSVERLYSRGHNGCSGNSQLAIQQFRACEKLYRQKKGGAKEAGMGRYEMDPQKYSKEFGVPIHEVPINENGKVWVDKLPIIAEHFFLSFHTSESIPYNIHGEIIDKLCASEPLRDFYAVSNSHWNTDEEHDHIIVSNFSKDGSKKLSMNNAKRNELRKELDRICALEYGLSIIDDPYLRWQDPEREEFIRQLVNAGEVDVYAPADYEKQLKPHRPYDRWMLEQIRAGRVKVAEGVSKNRHCTQEEAYRKWIAQMEDFNREVDKQAAKKEPERLLTFEETKDPKVTRIYYWEYRYRSIKYPDHYHAVRIYDEFGRKRTILELLIMLAILYAKQEGIIPTPYEELEHRTIIMHRDWKAQNAMDLIRYQREQGVRTPDELQSRIQAVGTDLAEAKRGLAYYKKAVENGKELKQAATAFFRLAKVRKERALTEEEEMVAKEAYRIMCAHKCYKREDVYEFIDRDHYSRRKVEDLEEQVKKLKKDYHDLKFIEAHIDDARREIECRMYTGQSLDDLIQAAESMKEPPKERSVDFEKIF